MKFFNIFKKKISFKLIDCDYAPEDMPKQLPIEFTIERRIPGSDRSDYFIAVCKKTIYYNEKEIKYIVVGSRFGGDFINESTKYIALNVAYVIDESLLKDKIMSFDKCKYVAICMAVRI